MNQKNAEKLAAEMKELGFNKKAISDMEKQIKKGSSEFQLETRAMVGKTTVDYILHFRQSTQSDFYFLNKYDAILDKGKPIGAEDKYMVFFNDDKGAQKFKNFDNPHLAVDFFNAQKGQVELKSGPSPQQTYNLVNKENDKVTYVEKDFRSVYYVPAVKQTMYVENGKGFTTSQAANLLDGRAVYRDDLMNMAGQQYKAWVMLDFEKEKDRFQNYKTRQFNDPAYGFNLQETLAKYHILELKNPSQLKMIEESLKNGNRVPVTVEVEGKQAKMMIEAVPRFSQLKFFNENGRSEKREQFMKESAIEKKQESAPVNDIKENYKVSR